MFIVIPFPMKTRANQINAGVYSLALNSKTRPTVAYASMDLAEQAAQAMAENNPDVNIAIMGVATVVEAQKGPVTFVRKIVNSNGELVPEGK